jgi:hypothetical protein
MSKKNTLLEENTVRRFMKLANIGGLTDGHVEKRNNRIDEMGGMYDEDLYEAEEDDPATMAPEEDDLGAGAPEGEELPPEGEELPPEGDEEMGLDDTDLGAEAEPEGEGGGDAATSIVDATVAGLEKGLKAAGILGDDDSLTTSPGDEGGEDMGDLDAGADMEEPMPGEGEEAGMAPSPEMGGEEDELPPEEPEDPEAMNERALNEIARRVAVRLLQRRIRK